MSPTSECSGCEKSDWKCFHGVEAVEPLATPAVEETFHEAAPVMQWPAVRTILEAIRVPEQDPSDEPFVSRISTTTLDACAVCLASPSPASSGALQAATAATAL